VEIWRAARRDKLRGCFVEERIVVNVDGSEKTPELTFESSASKSSDREKAKKVSEEE
jgi:hypothetical protein